MAVLRKAKKQLTLLAVRFRHRKYNVFLLGSIAFSWVLVCIGVYTTFSVSPQQQVLGTRIAAARNIILTPVIEVTIEPSPSPTIAPHTPTPFPTPTTKRINYPTKTPTQAPSNQNSPQYTAEKIDDVTWKVKDVANDTTMASPQDIVNALNSYRGEKGKGNLTVDINLSTFAQERANLFSSNGSLDSHAGFQSYMNNGGFEKSGFNGLGENSAMLSGPMSGEKIIKNIFGADPPHDGNQLDDWTHVGVGVSGNAVNVNFGKNKR